MVDAPNAAVKALADEMLGIYLETSGTTADGMIAVARHVLAGRQPKLEDVEDVHGVIVNAKADGLKYC